MSHTIIAALCAVWLVAGAIVGYGFGRVVRWADTSEADWLAQRRDRRWRHVTRALLAINARG